MYSTVRKSLLFFRKAKTFAGRAKLDRRLWVKTAVLWNTFVRRYLFIYFFFRQFLFTTTYVYMYCTVNTTTFVNSVEILVNIKPLVHKFSYIPSYNIRTVHVRVRVLDRDTNERKYSRKYYTFNRYIRSFTSVDAATSRGRARKYVYCDLDKIRILSKFRTFGTGNLITGERPWPLQYTYWPITCGNLIELGKNRTGVKASILTDCVGQLRFNWNHTTTYQIPTGYGPVHPPPKGGFCPRLPCAERRHSSRVSSFRVDPCDRWLLKSLWCRQHRAYGYFLPKSIDFL